MCNTSSRHKNADDVTFVYDDVTYVYDDVTQHRLRVINDAVEKLANRVLV